MGLVRDDGYEKTAALRAIAGLLDMARTSANDAGADALAQAIADAERIALEDIRRTEH